MLSYEVGNSHYWELSEASHYSLISLLKIARWSKVQIVVRPFIFLPENAGHASYLALCLALVPNFLGR